MPSYKEAPFGWWTRSLAPSEMIAMLEAARKHRAESPGRMLLLTHFPRGFGVAKNVQYSH